MDSLYKGLLKNYSIQLSDTISSKVEPLDIIYNKIINPLETYITEILPIKLRMNNKNDYKNILNDYEKYESMLVGKLDERDIIRQRMMLLGLSRELFTHSLPLIAAEQCYKKLISDTRNLVIQIKEKPKKDRTFLLLCDVIEDYNVRLLSTKVYWDNPEERESYKEFWNKYKEIDKISDENEKSLKKQILFLKNDIKTLEKNETNYNKIIKAFKKKLVELGAIRNINNSCKTIEGQFKKVKVS